MNNFKRYPTPAYDEPAIYNDFTGGMNTDRNGDNLLQNELRNAVNMHYDNLSLCKRKGAEIIKDLKFGKELINGQLTQTNQHVFLQNFTLFTPRNITYLVMHNNGRLYYSVYDDNLEIEWSLLNIDITTDYAVGIDKRQNIPLPITKHNGFVYERGDDKVQTLITQNRTKTESAIYKSELYFATGTRIIKVYEKDYSLYAEVLTGYKPVGLELTAIGNNWLYPYPMEYVQTQNYDSPITSISSIVVKYVSDTEVHLQTVMNYAPGESASLYKFRWSRQEGSYNTQGTWTPSGEWEVISPLFKSDDSYGIHVIGIEDGFNYKYKVEFANVFQTQFYPEEEYDSGEVDEDDNPIMKKGVVKDKQTTVLLENGTEVEDLTIEKLMGNYSGAAETLIALGEDNKPAKPSVHPRFLAIQSCKKILADGSKFIFYDDDYNSGEIFKTAVDNISYITWKGGLSFKTTYDETLVKLIHFKGVIIAFANNRNIGGNISMITGNGDDYASDNTYSPYQKSVINTAVSCTNAATVKVADNYLLFKFNEIIYMIEGSELTSEVVSVYPLNLRVRDKSIIPWDDDNCIAEVTQEYFALVWNRRHTLTDQDSTLQHEAIRAKLYYHNGTMIGNMPNFPWLVDKGDVFDVQYITEIGSISTHITQGYLVQYTSENYQDLDKNYVCSVSFRPHDLNYPKVIKLVNSINIYYFKDNHKTFFTVRMTNEANKEILVGGTGDGSDVDDAVLKWGDKLGGKMKQGTTILDGRTVHAQYQYPLIMACVTIESEGKGEFSIAGIVYNYETTDIPLDTMYDMYNKFISTDDARLATEEAERDGWYETLESEYKSPISIKRSNKFERGDDDDMPTVKAPYAPTAAERNYPIGTQWIHDNRAERTMQLYTLVSLEKGATWFKHVGDTKTNDFLFAMDARMNELQSQVDATNTKLPDGLIVNRAAWEPINPTSNIYRQAIPVNKRVIPEALFKVNNNPNGTVTLQAITADFMVDHNRLTGVTIIIVYTELVNPGDGSLPADAFEGRIACQYDTFGVDVVSGGTY